jgi:acetyl-CoA carboxylase biotin carboxyl carrier protein
MDLRKLKKLIDLVEESSITELEINDAEERVRIVKHGAPPGQQVWPMPPAAHAQAADRGDNAGCCHRGGRTGASRG